MQTSPAEGDPLAQWLRLPARLRRALHGRSGEELDASEGEKDVSAREYVHHLVEANLVASTMILAALGRNGCEFDWTWLLPDRAWMRRAGYDRAEIAPALSAFAALTRYVASLLRTQPDTLQRKVLVRNAPGELQYALTIEGILRQEVDHARTHLEELRAARRPR